MPVTWSDIVRLADGHPRLMAGRRQTEAARAATVAARSAPNPTLEGTVGQGRGQSGDDRSRVEWGLTLSLPLGWIAQRGSRVVAAEAEVNVAAAESAVIRRQVLAELRARFWALASEQARVTALEAVETQTATLVRTVQKRVDNGEARPVEATRVEIERERVASELEAARSSRRARQAELGVWLSAPPDAPLTAVADLESLPTVLARDAAIGRMRASHPALAVVQASGRAAEAQVRVEKVARVPSFALAGMATSEVDRRAYGVGLTLDVPIWNWNRGRIAQAESRLAAARYQADAVRLEIESAVLDAQGACQASVATAARFKDRIVPRSESAAAIMERTYQLGEATLLEVIDARRTLLDARRVYLGALSQVHADCGRLADLVGEETP